MSSEAKRVEEYGVRTVKGRWSEWSMDENGPECYTDAAGTSGLSMEDLAWLIEPYREALWPAPSTTAAKAGDGWIRCSERMPDVHDRVLALTVCGDPIVMDYAGAGDFVLTDDDQERLLVSHWMPILPKPTEGGDGGA